MTGTYGQAVPFSILIPVFNETDALRFSIHYMRRLGISPIYVLDRKRTAEAQAILVDAGLPLVFYDNDKPFIENGYQSLVSRSPTDWVLRLDCDEVPSPDMLSFCRDLVQQEQDTIVGFERHQLLWQGSGFLTATTERFSPSNQRQWRLFNRCNVQYNQHIHTPGIHVTTAMSAPANAEVYHLSWVFLTWEDRVAKAARYDAHGQPSGNRNNQLFPLQDVEWEAFDRPFLRDGYLEWVRARTLIAPSE